MSRLAGVPYLVKLKHKYFLLFQTLFWLVNYTKYKINVYWTLIIANISSVEHKIIFADMFNP